MPVMQEYQQSGRIRYLGVTTSRNEEHGAMLEAMRKYPLDFIQIDYSLANRSAAQELLPLALERKVAVMVNVPLGGRRGSLISEAAGRGRLPDAARLLEQEHLDQDVTDADQRRTGDQAGADRLVRVHAQPVAE